MADGAVCLQTEVTSGELNIADGQIWLNNAIKSNSKFRKKEERVLGLSSNSSEKESETVPCVKARKIELFYLTNFYVFKTFLALSGLKFVCNSLYLTREVETTLIVSSVGLVLQQYFNKVIQQLWFLLFSNMKDACDC